MTTVQPPLEKSGGQVSKRWKPYPAYKSSGVEWLGDVPEHWEVKRLKYLASINDDALPETTDPDYEFDYVDIGSVNAVDGITTRERMIFENAPSRARRRVKADDTIVSTVRTYLRAIAPITEAAETTIVSTGFAVVRPRKVDPSYLAYALRESSFVESIVARSIGVSYPAVNASEVGCVAVPLPNSDEQHAIADFLDRETGKIDRLVAKKRELIEKLKEKRAALISRTVTRGLNPDAKLKPSGVEWLRDVPEEWDAIPLKWRARTRSGDGIATEDVQADASADNPIPVIGGNGLMGYCATGNVRSPVIVIGRVGALCGNVHQVTPPAWITDNALILTADPKGFDLSYLAAVLRMRNLNELADKTAQPLITGTRVRAVTVPKPPLPEQRAIAHFLDHETGKIHRLAAKVEEVIGRLQEYRAALITAAVTGKIDVSTLLNTGVSAALNAGLREGEGGPREYPMHPATYALAAENSAVYGTQRRPKAARKN